MTLKVRDGSFGSLIAPHPCLKQTRVLRKQAILPGVATMLQIWAGSRAVIVTAVHSLNVPEIAMDQSHHKKHFRYLFQI